MHIFIMSITVKVIIVVFALVSLFGGMFLVVQEKWSHKVAEQLIQKKMEKEHQMKSGEQ